MDSQNLTSLKVVTKESEEIWKPIPGFGDYYMASSFGRIKCVERVVEKRARSGKLIKQVYKERILLGSDRLGYRHHHLGFNGRKISIPEHHLVLMAFVSPKPDGMECCHNDSDPSNNRIENLRWDTHLENNRDRVRRGSYLLGENHKMAKYKESDIMDLLSGAKTHKELGIRYSHAWRIKNGKCWSYLQSMA